MREILPSYTKNQTIGNRSASILKAVMQKFCLFQEMDQGQDLGIDFIGTIIENQKPTEYNFNAQCKGTDNPNSKLNSDGTVFIYPIKTSTVNYWKQKKDVTLLFLVDEESENIYWAAPLREIEGKDLSNQDTYTFHICKENILNSHINHLPEAFIFEIIRYYASFSDGVIKQFHKIQAGNFRVENMEYLFELLQVLKSNFEITVNEYEKTVSNLIEKINNDLQRTLVYCSELEQMDDIVRIYCPKGVYKTEFGADTELKTVIECSEEIRRITSCENPTLEDLYKTSKKIFAFRGNLLGFLREMKYEDNPCGNHDDIEEEYTEWLKASGISI